MTTGAPGRSPAEIRRDIEAKRLQLGGSVELLRTRVNELTDWRTMLARHRKQVLVGAAVAGFVIGGGIAGFAGIFKRG